MRFGNNLPGFGMGVLKLYIRTAQQRLQRQLSSFTNVAVSKFLKLNDMSLLTSHLCITSVPEGTEAAHVA